MNKHVGRGVPSTGDARRVILALVYLVGFIVAVAVAMPAQALAGTRYVEPSVAPGAAHRGYELVSPADKPGGQGVGQSSSIWPDGLAKPGIASVDGDRYVSGSFAGNLTPGSFLYNTDYAFSERMSDRVGWVSHSPFTHPEYARKGGANTNFDPTSASADLSVFGWSSTSGGGLLFPEMASWPSITNGNRPMNGNYATSWQGRWELTAPTEPSLNPARFEQFVSADGTHLPFETETAGQLGPGDPSLDQVAGNALYDDYVPGGTPFLPSNQFAPDGVRSLVGVCTGEGASRTRIPAVNGSGEAEGQVCPPPLPGRDAALVSSGGAAITSGPSSGSVENAVSDDGARIFFVSPDPGAAGVSPPCQGEGATTSCPAQLYVRQLDSAGNPTVRWISRSTVPGQAASLMSRVVYEGASVTGSRVIFRTAAPLTPDDPNGTGSAPVTAGSPSAESSDLYEYEVPSNAEGRPDASDPGAGTLTRISAGPTGQGDCNVGALANGGIPQGAGALRFASEDGRRLYFVCAAPLAGVPTNGAPTDGAISTAAGLPMDGTFRNLYYYDSTKPRAERWEFVARLPTGATPIDGCATTLAEPGQPISFNAGGENFGPVGTSCFKGTADGRFVTFDTSGRLLAGDPDESSVDVYAFDAEADRLIRIDAPQGGAGGIYGCGGTTAAPTTFCFGDSGKEGAPASLTYLPGVVTHPTDPGEHVAFFESKSRLVAADTNDQYDVYEWDDGTLSLISTGSGDRGAYYAGNSADGRDVFFETQAPLTWQDTDGVMDVYDARIGGGIPEPEPGTLPCAVLGSQCQPPASPPPPATLPGSAGLNGPSNQATPKPKKNPRAKGRKKKPRKCKKGKVRRHGKCVEKEHHQRKKHHQRTQKDKGQKDRASENREAGR